MSDNPEHEHRDSWVSYPSIQNMVDDGLLAEGEEIAPGTVIGDVRKFLYHKNTARALIRTTNKPDEQTHEVLAVLIGIEESHSLRATSMMLEEFFNRFGKVANYEVELDDHPTHGRQSILLTARFDN